MKVGNRLLAGALVVDLLACVYWVFHESGTLTTILDPNALHALVIQLGAWRPAAIIGLMVSVWTPSSRQRAKSMAPAH
ncbi:hypothetical protein [Hydrogenophaga sp. PAMC20947]|uniref:hypothetical protein n=1 Tax=Hydrogenophaga sp. PAMC20947 TaxID=2565558 RepID=UPI00109E0785|nr:hypothetical protein [Hydrogenophaga sp. PAMC20947]QCB45393.1 hypothetical protein E5678_04725 [Hydrogenophaga sp. PAMC20947]